MTVGDDNAGGLPGEVRGPALRRAMSLSTVAWMFGSVWMTTTAGTPLANYAQSLGISEVQKGLLAALPFIATLLSLPASLLIERTGKRKRIFFWGLYFQRVMWIPIALLPYWMVRTYGQSATPHAMTLFLVLIFIMHTGQAIGGPAWVSWMADLVPDKLRGVYFGRRRQWGILPAVPAALLVGWLLDRHADGSGLTMMAWCSGIFLVAAVFGFLDIALFHWVPEIPRDPKPGAHIFSAWRDPLRNGQFLRFAGFVAMMVFAISFMGQFVTFYIIEHLGEPSAGAGRGSLNMITQMMVIVVPAIAQLMLFSLWGRAVDKMGKKPVVILASLGLVPVALGWCLVTRQHIWLGYVLSGLGAALWAGVEVANFNVVLQWSGSGDDENQGKGGTGYMAINAVIINIAGFTGGISAGFLAQWLRDMNWEWVTAFKTFTFYDVLFLLSGVMRLGAVLIFASRIHEPAAAPTRQTLRFMTSNIYNNLQTAALQPLRFMRLRGRESYREE